MSYSVEEEWASGYKEIKSYFVLEKEYIWEQTTLRNDVSINPLSSQTDDTMFYMYTA